MSTWRYKYKFTFLITLTCFFAGCITVNLGKKTAERAKGVKYQAPQHPPFEEFSNPNVDEHWKNKKNGNSISFLSDCNDPSDPSLESIQRGIVQGISETEFIKSESLNFHSREAKRSLVRGKVDGVPSMLEFLIFKRNNCIYVLTYVALEKTYQDNTTDFQRFIDGFEVP